MVCLSWKEIDSCPKAVTSTCPGVSWFWWLLAGAAAFVVLGSKKGKTK
jgi:hypothetical protein